MHVDTWASLGSPLFSAEVSDRKGKQTWATLCLFIDKSLEVMWLRFEHKQQENQMNKSCWKPACFSFYLEVWTHLHGRPYFRRTETLWKGCFDFLVGFRMRRIPPCRKRASSDYRWLCKTYRLLDRTPVIEFDPCLSRMYALFWVRSSRRNGALRSTIMK